MGHPRSLDTYGDILSLDDMAVFLHSSRTRINEKLRLARDPQRGEKRAGLPAPAGGVVVDARATRCPAVPPKQIGGAAGFVQTHEVGDIPGRRRRVPRDPRGRDVRPIVFGRADRFF